MSALALVSLHRVESKDRRVKKVKRVILAKATLVKKEIVGLRGLPDHLVLQDLQLRWSDLGMALLCSSWPDPLDHQDRQGWMGLQDLQELMGNLVIQERMEELVLLGCRVFQEFQEVLVPKAKRVNVERVSRDPEAPQVHLDLLDLVLVIVQHLLTWRARDSQTWIKSGVHMVHRVSQVLLALLGSLVLQWQWALMVQ